MHLPVAIIGYSHRLPGGIRSDEDFRRLLSEREIVQEPVADRYGRGYRPVDAVAGSTRLASDYEGLIRDDDELCFDRSLFGISRHEAKQLDPQMRMLLTCTWETCERAGWSLQSLRNSATGVFIGAQTPATATGAPRRPGNNVIRFEEVCGPADQGRNEAGS